MLEESQINKPETETLKCEGCGFTFSNTDEQEADDFIEIEETGLCTECNK